MVIEKFVIGAIQKAQRNELLGFLNDSEFAAAESRTARHACLGWIADLGGGSRVLELGCGPGRYVAMLSSMDLDVWGVDPFDFDTWRDIEGRPNVHLMSDVRAEELPFEGNSFDHVCCLGALLYFERPQDAISEMARVLKPGGSLTLRTVNAENFYTQTTGEKLDPNSNSLYSMSQLKSLVKDGGFLIEDSFSYGYHPPRFRYLYWVATNLFISERMKDRLSDWTPSKNRTQIVIHATLGE